MLDAKIQEQASLYVLDMLPEQEKLEMDLLISRDAEVRQWIRGMQANIEAMALSVPPAKAPSGVWTSIEARINARQKPAGIRRWQQTWLPLAACFALGALLSWFSFRSGKTRGGEGAPAEISASTSHRQQELRVNGPAGHTPADASKFSTLLAEQQRNIQRLDQALSQERARQRALENQFEDLSSNARRLSEQLARYRQAEPGMKRLLVMNLSNPASNNAAINFAQIANKILASEAQNQLAATGGKNQANASPDSNSSVASISSTPEITALEMEGGGVMTTSEAPSETSLTNTTGAQQSSAGKSEQQLNAAKSAEASGTNAGPVGVLVYDQAEQKGSLVLQGVPQPPAGSSYQVWIYEGQSSQPVHLGTLPALQNGGGEIKFGVTNAGLALARLLITLEPGMNITAPSGAVLMDGPRAGSLP